MGFQIENGVLEKYTEEPGVTEVVIPDGITTIAIRAFCGCNSLTSVIIPDSVKTIQKEAFLNCNALRDVRISPDSLCGCKDLFLWECAIPSLSLHDLLTVIKKSPKNLKEKAEKIIMESSDKEAMLYFEKQSRLEEYAAFHNTNADTLRASMPKPTQKAATSPSCRNDGGKKTPKLSEQKKVELLENAVLTGTVEDVRQVMNTHSPIEFTARALGYAARFRGTEMVTCLLEHGATFAYEATPAFVKKYAVKVTISNFYSYNVDYSLYLLKDQKISPEPDGVKILPDEGRAKVLEALHGVGAEATVNESDILYYSILYGDTAIREACAKLGICKLSEKRAANIRCDTNYAHMDGLERHLRDEFTWTLRRATAEDFKRIMMDILPLLGDKTMQLMPTDLYENSSDKTGFYSSYCAEGIFEQMLIHTNLTERVKKWDLVCALVEQNHLTGLNDALEQNWISKAKDYTSLLEYAQSHSATNAAIIGCIMEHINQKGAQKTEPKLDSLSMDPNSVTEIKKSWTYKKLEDGTLRLNSYKGSEIDIIIPQMIGKTQVTVIGEDCLSSNPLRSISQEQKEIRKKIRSVVVPEGITTIEPSAFYACSALTHVELPQSLRKIGANAFCDCRELREIDVPQATEVAYGVFAGCAALADEGGFIVYRGALYGYVGKEEKVTLPGGIIRVRTGTFTGQDKIKVIIFSKDTVEIEERVANFCHSLRVVGIYPATEKIAPNAFGSDRVSVIGWTGTAAEAFAQEKHFPFKPQGNG